MPIKPEGISEVRTWWVILGMFILAVLTQGLKAADIEPPLRLRRVVIRALLAGIAAVTFGLLVIGRFEVGWATLLGGAAVVGYIGAEVLAWLGIALKGMFDNFVATASKGKGGGP